RSQYDPGWKIQGRDQFRPTHWEFGQYEPGGFPAGPGEDCLLTTQQESPDGPLGAELAMAHRSEPFFSKGFAAWKDTTRWIYAPYAFEKLYRLETWKTLALEPGPSFQRGEWARQLEKGPALSRGPFQQKPIEKFLPDLGFSFQDPTADLIQKLPSFGFPPGVVVTGVRPQSPAAATGLLPDDIVIMADWRVADNAALLEEILDARKAAAETGPSPEPLTLIYWRQGVYFHGTVTP
ncbi:MAG TPA: PDZ domain-containing protein, partial [bacterium]|nr:PDZ domain-containing protein [bacterium]